MTIENPFFKLHDKVTAAFEANNMPSWQTRGGLVSSLISSCTSDYGSGFQGMTAALLERGKFYFGSESGVWSFVEWCNKRTNDEILFVIERTGLLFEERRKASNGEKFNPFLRTLEVIDHPRTRWGWNNRGEINLMIHQSVCIEKEINLPYSGDERDVSIATIIDEMGRKEDSFLDKDEAIAIMLAAIREKEPDTQIDPTKRFWTMHTVFDIMPFDFDKIRAIMLDAAARYDELEAIKEEQQKLNLEIGAIAAGTELELAGPAPSEAYYG